jgi:hypothetical protein
MEVMNGDVIVGFFIYFRITPSLKREGAMAPFYFIINRAQSTNTFPRVESAPSRGCHAIATASLLSRARSRQRRWMLQMLVWGRLVLMNLAMKKLPSTAVA